MMKPSFKYVNLSESNRTANPKVNRAEAEDKIVLEVTDVLVKEVLNVSCARNQRGAT
jgi:hypothetical protein